MLSFLFLLCVLWIGYWSYALWRDIEKPSPVYISRHRCADCAEGSLDNQRRSEHGSESVGSSDTASSPSIESKPTPPTESKPSPPVTSKPNPGTSNSESAETGNKKSGVVPLFTAPTEVDDLKEIKGVGVVMERTLNDLGITTFKQLAEFKDAEVQMVTDALSELSAGFGDRITRDEWVSQAKEFAAKKQG